MLSLRQILPTMPMIAASSAAHLAAIEFPPMLRRLYIAREDDPAGQGAYDDLASRAQDAGIDALPLDAKLGDFNDDLRQLGADAMRADVRVRLTPEDAERFIG